MRPCFPLLLAALHALFPLVSPTELANPPPARFTDVVSPDFLPPPWQDPKSICQSSLSAPASICDPSRLLSPRQLARLNAALADIHDGIAPYSLVSCDEDATDESTGFRVAVALVRRMTFDHNTLKTRAENFANTLFTQWNLNANCGASVLLFLSLEDRRMFIRTGALATKYLNEHQIDKVYKKMIPLLVDNHMPEALFVAVARIGSYLAKYKGKHSGARNTHPPPSGASVPLFFRGGPSWWDLELSIVAAVFAVFAVIACCNGAGGKEATRRKRDKRQVLRKLNIIRAEYVAAMLPQYIPATCPMCEQDLTPAWAPTVPVLPENEALQESQTEPLKPVRELRCRHMFHEQCFDDEQPTPSGSIPQCPTCGDRGGGTSTPPSLSSTRGQDAAFRLKKLQELYPHILTDDVIAKLSSEMPNLWPENMTEAYLQPRMGSDRSFLPGQRDERGNDGGGSGGGFWNGLGGLLAAGGIGAMLAGMFGGWGWGWGGNRRRRNGEDGGFYSDIPSLDDGGGHGAQWTGDNVTQGGGHGVGWGDSVRNAAQGGGHGAGWGNTLGSAVSHISGGGLGSGWGGSGGQGDGGGGHGGGGHGSGW